MPAESTEVRACMPDRDLAGLAGHGDFAESRVFPTLRRSRPPMWAVPSERKRSTADHVHRAAEWNRKARHRLGGQCCEKSRANGVGSDSSLLKSRRHSARVRQKGFAFRAAELRS